MINKKQFNKWIIEVANQEYKGDLELIREIINKKVN